MVETEELIDVDEELTKDDEVAHATAVCHFCKPPRMGSIVNTLCGRLVIWRVLDKLCPVCVALFNNGGNLCSQCGGK